MLANPILIGPFDAWFGALAVVLALQIECAVAVRLVGDRGGGPWRLPFLAAVNAVTWPLFAATLPHAWYWLPPEPAAALLELAVIVVEGLALWAGSRTRWGTALVVGSPLPWFRALMVALWANLASVVAGFLFVALVLKPHGALLVLALTGVVTLVANGVPLRACASRERRHVDRAKCTDGSRRCAPNTSAGLVRPTCRMPDRKDADAASALVPLVVEVVTGSAQQQSAHTFEAGGFAAASASGQRA